jgi:tripartite-type tricarboxylate transporter receptor subunit TctC
MQTDNTARTKRRTDRRASGLAEIPTIAEGGIPDYDLTTWWGLFAPSGTPPEIVARIHRDTLAALQNAELKERFAALSVDSGGGSSRDFADYVRQEIAKYDRIVKQLNIKAE